jgi:predicted transcriptional regulator
MTQRAAWMHTADHRILDYLRRERPDYAPLIANRLGMHLKYVEQRIEVLCAYGLLEAISGEVVYCITERGIDYLEGALDPATLTPASDEA